MAFFPTSNEINKEVECYETSSFFNKSKNLLVTFIVVSSTITILSQERAEFTFIVMILAVSYNLIFAIFIYLNHRWAMVTFCAIYLGDKVVFIAQGFGSPGMQIIIGAIVLTLTITSVKVASKLKK